MKQLYMDNRCMRIGSDEQTSFHDDTWRTTNPMKHMFQELYEICVKQPGDIL
jgi:hypothetical protein